MKFCYLTEVEQGDKKASLYFYAKGPKEAAERAAEKAVVRAALVWWSIMQETPSKRSNYPAYDRMYDAIARLESVRKRGRNG